MSIRRHPRQEKKAFVADTAETRDGFQNFTAHVGRGTGNQGDGAHYGFNPISRNRLQMDLVYRGSWIAGRVASRVMSCATASTATRITIGMRGARPSRTPMMRTMAPRSRSTRTATPSNRPTVGFERSAILPGSPTTAHCSTP